MREVLFSLAQKRQNLNQSQSSCPCCNWEAESPKFPAPLAIDKCMRPLALASSGRHRHYLFFSVFTFLNNLSFKVTQKHFKLSNISQHYILTQKTAQMSTNFGKIPIREEGLMLPTKTARGRIERSTSEHATRRIFSVLPKIRPCNFDGLRGSAHCHTNKIHTKVTKQVKI